MQRAILPVKLLLQNQIDELHGFINRMTLRFDALEAHTMDLKQMVITYEDKCDQERHDHLEEKKQDRDWQEKALNATLDRHSKHVEDLAVTRVNQALGVQLHMLSTSSGSGPQAIHDVSSDRLQAIMLEVESSAGPDKASNWAKLHRRVRDALEAVGDAKVHAERAADVAVEALQRQKAEHEAMTNRMAVMQARMADLETLCAHVAGFGQSERALDGFQAALERVAAAEELRGESGQEAHTVAAAMANFNGHMQNENSHRALPRSDVCTLDILGGTLRLRRKHDADWDQVLTARGPAGAREGKPPLSMVSEEDSDEGEDAFSI